MKLMFISDIHGLKTNLEKVDKVFKDNNCEKLIILGDILYLYPSYRNSIDYDINKVVSFIKKYKDKIICIRGNCDLEEYNQYVDIKLDNDIDYIDVDNIRIYLTHGHIYNEDNWNKSNSILVYGHLHKPFIRKKDTNIFINPGSISLPRGIFKASYMIFENKTFTIYDIDNNKIAEEIIN